MYDFIVYNPKYAITQNDAWTYEMYGLCTLHEELDIGNKVHNKNSLGLKTWKPKSRVSQITKHTLILDLIHATKAWN